MVDNLELTRFLMNDLEDHDLQHLFTDLNKLTFKKYEALNQKINEVKALIDSI
jgi:hypothetical protein